MKTLYTLFVALFAFTALAQPPPIQRNVITTNTPGVVTFGGAAQVNDTILGWDTTDNKFVDFQIGANLTYTHATHTLSGGAGGSGVSIASIYTGMLSTNAGNTLVTITGIPPAAIYGILSNSITGSAQYVTTSPLTNQVYGSNVIGSVSQTPWLSDIDAAGFSGTNGGKLIFTNFVTAVKGAGSTNNASGSGASIFGAAFANSTNDATGVGSFISGVASNASWNRATGIAAHISGSAINGSTNEVSGNYSALFGSTFGGGLSRVSGAGTLMFSEIGASGGRNLNSSATSIAIMSADGGTNTVTGSSQNVMIGAAQGSGSRNQISDAGGTSSGHILIGGAFSGGTNIMDGSFSSAKGGVLIGNAIAGGRNSFDLGSGISSIAIGIASGGTNDFGSSSALGMALANAGALNQVTSGGGILLARAGTGGSKNIINASGLGGILIGLSDAGGANNAGTATAAAGYKILFGMATTGTNEVTGTGSALFGYSDNVVGNTFSTGDRSWTFGSGGTNVASDSFAYYSRGAPLLFAKTNAVGINTATPRPGTLDVNLGTTHKLSVTNEDLTASTIMGVGPGKREVSVAMGTGLAFDGVTQSVSGVLTNSTTGNAATSTKASFVNDISTNVVTFAQLGITNTPSANTNGIVATGDKYKFVDVVAGSGSSTPYTTNIVVNYKAPFTTNYTATTSGLHLYCTGTNQVITLPTAAAGVSGLTTFAVPLHVTSTTGNIIVTNANGSDLIGGALSFAVGAECSVTLYSDGTNWHP